nr:retrovirus-related Pol polyprotein from transposon TNT 1-94 [Tanacetum cinerariifolium]
SDEENSVANDRFKKDEGYHAVLPLFTRNYMPPKPDLSFAGLDDSIYKFKISEIVTSLAKDEKDAPETSTACVEKPKEDRSSASRIEDWKTESDDDDVFTPEPIPAKIDFMKAVSVVNGNGVTAIKTSAGYVWRPRVNAIDQLSKDNRWIYTQVDYVDLQGRLKESSTKPPVRPYLALVTNTHNKTPYELLNGRSPRLDFMRPFGCPITILNTLDPLVKFKGKADEGFLVGYSVTSKAFRVFNTKIRKVEENLHVRFLENKHNVAGTRPNWIFDIDSLTNSMNYIPVSSGNQTDKNAGPQDTNGNAGTQDNVNVGKEVSDQHYIVFLLWSSISSTYKSSDDKPADDKPKDDTVFKTCNKQTIVATSTTKAKYVAAAHCCGKQNMLLLLIVVDSAAGFSLYCWMKLCTASTVVDADELRGGDNVERAITSDASLVTTQDSDNIAKTQSTTMSIDPISQEIGSGDRTRRQETTLGVQMLRLGLRLHLKGPVIHLSQQILSSPSTYQRKHRKTHKPRKAKKVTELPQTSVALDIGADETVHQEGVTMWKGLSLAPRNHVRGADAQTRFETASKRSSDPPLSTGQTIRSREDMMEQETNLTDFVPQTPHDLPLSGGHTPGSDEGRPNLLKLMNICTKLSNKVLALEEAKTT